VNADLTPALVAAGGGSAMLTGIWWQEHRREAAMRASRERLGLRFPLALDAGVGVLALRSLAGSSGRLELVFEVVVTPEGISHCLLVPKAARRSVASALSAAIPSLWIGDAEDASPGRSRMALRLHVPTPCVLSTEHPEVALRTLASLQLRTGERVVVRMAVRSGPAPILAGRQATDDTARRIERAWRDQTGRLGFRVAGLALIQAGSAARASELAAHISSIWRSRRGPVAALRISSERSARPMAVLPQTKRASGWLNPEQLLGLLMLPLGETAIPGVEVGRRELPVPRELTTKGRPLFIGRDAFGHEQTVRLSERAARQHLIVLGLTGAGKSVVTGAGVLSDIEYGHAGVVIDPKADLIASILERIKPEHADQVVVLDPGDATRPTAAIDLLHSGDPDACTDVLVRTFKAMFPDWGIRSETWGRLGLRTLCALPEATLADLGRIYSDDSFRHQAVARLDDPFLVSQWQGYEALSPAAKVDVVAAPLARMMALLSRPKVRAVLASPEPKLDIARLFAERKFLLVSLAPGVVGDAAQLIGAAVMFVIWSAIEARAAIPAEQRHHISIHADELSTITNGLPMGFELAAERARGLGAGLSVAIQTLARIPEPTRSALLGNAANFVTFRAPGEEAAAIARQLPGLSAGDVAALGRFEVAARLSTGDGSAVQVVTGRTEPLPDPTGMGEVIRDESAARYGTPASSEAPISPAPDDDAEPLLGAERRRS
jgi:hypothetical protein